MGPTVIMWQYVYDVAPRFEQWPDNDSALSRAQTLVNTPEVGQVIVMATTHVFIWPD